MDTLARQKAQYHKTIKFLKREIEEIYQNPPLATLSPLFVFINIDPQTPNGKNMSGTDSLTPNSPTNAIVKKCTERLFNPLAYFNKRNKLCFFVLINSITS